jgi:hypothetical protein
MTLPLGPGDEDRELYGAQRSPFLSRADTWSSRIRATTGRIIQPLPG